VAGGSPFAARSWSIRARTWTTSAVTCLASLSLAVSSAGGGGGGAGGAMVPPGPYAFAPCLSHNVRAGLRTFGSLSRHDAKR
jgi:hypothetical protein